MKEGEDLVKSEKILGLIPGDSVTGENAISELENIFFSNPEKFKKKKENIFSVSRYLFVWTITIQEDKSKFFLLRKNILVGGGILYTFETKDPLYERIKVLFFKLKKILG